MLLSQSALLIASILWALPAYADEPDVSMPSLLRNDNASGPFGLAGLVLEFTVSFGGGALSSEGASLEPLQPLPKPGWGGDSLSGPMRPALSLRMGTLVLFRHWSVGLGLTGTSTGYWGDSLAASVRVGPAWSSGLTRLQLLANIGAEGIVNADGDTENRGTDAVAWLPQAGLEANWIQSRPNSRAAFVLEVFCRVDLVRENVIFTRVKPASNLIVSTPETRTVRWVSVGGFVAGVSIGVLGWI